MALFPQPAAALLLGGLLAGCASAPTPLQPIMTSAQEDVCCASTQAYTPPPPDCARRMLSIRQTDACVRCNDYSVPVRANGACVSN